MVCTESCLSCRLDSRGSIFSVLRTNHNSQRRVIPIQEVSTLNSQTLSSLLNAEFVCYERFCRVLVSDKSLCKLSFVWRLCNGFRIAFRKLLLQSGARCLMVCIESCLACRLCTAESIFYILATNRIWERRIIPIQGVNSTKLLQMHIHYLHF